VKKHEDAIDVVQVLKDELTEDHAATLVVLLKDYLLGTWLPTKKHSVKERTYVNYELVVRVHLIPRLGSLQLKDIRGHHLTAAWNSMMAEGMSAHVPQSCQRKLHNALEMARKEELIPNNPCRDAILPSVPRIGLRVLDEEQKEIALDYAKNDSQFKLYHPIFYLGLETGIRRGELEGLEWRDIDFEEKRLRVERSVYMGNGGVRIVTSTKTEESNRTVILFKDTIEFLKLLKFKQKRQAEHHGWEQSKTTCVFTREDGKPILGNAASRNWKRMMRKLGPGYKNTRFHDTRHTHVTELFMANTPVSAVQQRLGHRKESTTTDVYKHLMPGVQQTAMEQFEKARAKKRRKKVRSGTSSGTDLAHNQAFVPKNGAEEGIRTPDPLLGN